MYNFYKFEGKKERCYMDDRIEFLRTPEERFAHLNDYPFTANYLDSGGLRMHYVDEGEKGSQPVLMLHGEPTWSYLYRKIISPVAKAGFRSIAPDLIGFGKSDKPVRREDYTYQRHVDWVKNLIKKLKLKNIILICHDWGGLIGLRIAGENPELFSGVIACNTFLPTGDFHPGEAFMRWRRFSQETTDFHIGGIVKGGCVKPLPEEVISAYDAPFPDDRYKQGARQFPVLVPITPDDPASEPNRKAWETLYRWEKPFLTAFSDSDPITRGADIFLQQAIPGAKGQKHATIKNAGHFLQEDNPEQLVSVILDFLKQFKK